MVGKIILIVYVTVCVTSSAARNVLRLDKQFDDVQAAVFSRKSYPDLGDIPVLNRKIFRGSRVQIEEHPYVVSIRRFHSHYLVGAILSVHTIITVAHPVYNVPLSELGVVTGETYCDRGATYKNVLLVLTHGDFDPYTLKADLALLRLYEAIFHRISQKPIAIFNTFRDTKPPKLKGMGLNRKKGAEKAFVTGWGRCDWMGNELCLPRASVYFPDEKQDPMLRTVSFNHCDLNESDYCVGYEKHLIRVKSGEGMVCIGSAREVEPLAPCLAVPGAPLTVRAKLAGLLSWGFGCGYTHDLPLIYTDLRYYADWVTSNLKILDTLNTVDVSELYIASKAFFMQEWLQLTSDQRPQAHRQLALQPANIDPQLAKLSGDVTDLRDYAHGGILREQKAELYRDLRAELDEKRRIQEISQQVYADHEPLRSFINKKYYGLINNSNTSA